MRSCSGKYGVHHLPSLWFLLGGICLLQAVLPVHLTLVFLLSAALHECGHIAAMVLLGIPVRGLRMARGGAVLRGDLQGVSYWREFLAAAAGPLVNVLLAVFFFHSAWTYGGDAYLLNLMLACYNLLPLDGNDGAVMLAAAAAHLGYEAQMRRCLGWLSALLMAVLLMMGAWIFWYGALADSGGSSVGYGALFFCILVRGLEKTEDQP